MAEEPVEKDQNAHKDNNEKDRASLAGTVFH